MANHFAANHFGGQHWSANHFRGGLVPRVIDVGLSPNITALLIQCRSILKCKIYTSDLETELAVFDIEMDALASDIEQVAARLRNVEEGKWPPTVDMARILNCKIYETDLDDQLAALDVTIDTMDSDVSNTAARLRNLESQLRTYRRQRRANP